MTSNATHDAPFREYREWIARSYPLDVGDLRRERLARLHELMAADDLDCLVVSSAGAVAERALVRFAANYSTTGRQTCAVIDRDGVVTLLVTYSAHLAWAWQTSWANDVRLVSELAGAVAELVTLPGAGPRIGLAIPGPLGSAVRAAINSRGAAPAVVDVHADVMDLQIAKTPLELQLVEVSGAIAKVGIKEARSLAEPGVSERRLMAGIEDAVRSAGAESITILVGANGTVAGPMPTDRPLQQGDSLQVSVELAGPGGYWVQAVRTLPVGQANATLSSAVRRAEELERELASQLVIGRSLSSLDMAGGDFVIGMAAAVPTWHGIGLGMGEPPTSERGSDWPVREGMVIVLHPNAFNHDSGVFLGNTYRVSTAGAVAVT